MSISFGFFKEIVTRGLSLMLIFIDYEPRLKVHILRARSITCTILDLIIKFILQGLIHVVNLIVIAIIVDLLVGVITEAPSNYQINMT